MARRRGARPDGAPRARRARPVPPVMSTVPFDGQRRDRRDGRARAGQSRHQQRAPAQRQLPLARRERRRQGSERSRVLVEVDEDHRPIGMLRLRRAQEPPQRRVREIGDLVVRTGGDRAPGQHHQSCRAAAASHCCTSDSARCVARWVAPTSSSPGDASDGTRTTSACATSGASRSAHEVRFKPNRSAPSTTHRAVGIGAAESGCDLHSTR